MCSSFIENKSPIEREIAKLLILLSVASQKEKQANERLNNESSFVLATLMDIEATKINVAYELMLRVIKYSLIYFPDLDLYNLVQAECNR